MYQNVLEHAQRLGRIAFAKHHNFIIEDISDACLAYLAYTRQELQEKFHGDFLELVPTQERVALLTDYFQQSKQTDSYTMEVRIETAEHTFRSWLLVGDCTSGDGYAHSAVVYDITDHLREQERHLIQESIFNNIHIIHEDIFWCLNVKKRQIHFLSKHLDDFDLEEIMDNFPHCLLEKGVLSQEDYNQFFKSIGNIYAGKLENTEMRLKTKDDVVHWYENVYQLIHNQKDEYILGRLLNIDDKKHLEIKAQKDPLTSCLNKTATKTMIDTILQHSNEQDRHVLMMIDVDNFKQVNDNMGHAFGDEVLSHVGEKLHRAVRADDIVGRIGGDEFVVFFRNMHNPMAVQAKAEQVASVFRMDFPGKESGYHISGSVGVSFAFDHGKTYQELYEKADKAMYHAKKSGKNQYCIYSKALEQETTEVHPVTDFEHKSRFVLNGVENNFFLQIFQMMCYTKDLSVTIQAVMEMIGRRFHVSRIYIFESNAEQNLYYNTYEWCSEDVEPEIQNLQGIPVDVFGYVLDHLGEDNLYVCNDVTEIEDEGRNVLEAQGILAVLHHYVMKDQKPVLMVGFDECHYNRRWTLEEGQTLLFFSYLRNNTLMADTTKAKSDVAILWEYHQLKENADLDNLTKLPRQQKFYELTEAILREHSEEAKRFYMARINLADYQSIAGYYGEEESNRLIEQIAKALRQLSVGHLCINGRMDVSSFAIMAELRGSLQEKIDELEASMQYFVQHFRSDYRVEFYMGIYDITDKRTRPSVIYNRCSLAAKRCETMHSQHQRHVIYTPALQKDAIAEKLVLTNFETALLEKQFKVLYQPKVDLKTGKVVAAEALVRWFHPLQGFISPDIFIPICERTGLITRLDYYIWNEVCGFLAEQKHNGAVAVPISVNVSRVDLFNRNIVECFAQLLKQYDIPADLLHIEMTESAYTDNHDVIVEAVNGIRALGILVEMDDFGTGYSSLNIFNDLPIDILKLDMSFLANVEHDGKKQRMIDFILRLAGGFFIPVVAEGIETETQVAFLQTMGCSMGQGYYYSRPLPCEEYQNYLNAHI